MMDVEDVLEIVDCLEEVGIPVWLDGGWGVDALVGEWTRPHDDLDVVIALSDALAAQDVLAKLGFAITEDERPTRFVTRDIRDRRVDFHTVIFDEQGGARSVCRMGPPGAIHRKGSPDRDGSQGGRWRA